MILYLLLLQMQHTYPNNYYLCQHDYNWQYIVVG